MSSDEFIVTTSPGRSADATRRYAFRMAENFFRRWPLFMLPLLLLIGIGVVQARKAVADYRSVGVISVVNNPLLGDITAIQGSNVNTFETPAGATTQTINELLATDGFTEDVAARAGLKQALDSGALALTDIRSRVFAAANGYQLLQVSATWPSGQGAQQLAQATIDTYVNYVLKSQTAKTTDASTFWAGREVAYQKQVDAANQALKTYLAAHPTPAVGDRSEAQQLDIKTLTDAITQAQAQVTNAQSEKESADLTTQELSTAAGQGLQIVDSPVVPSQPEAIRRKQILTLAIYIVLGLILTACLLLVSTFLDRTVRSAEDIASATGLPVVATVPAVRALRKSPGRDGKKSSGSKQLALETR